MSERIPEIIYDDKLFHDPSKRNFMRLAGIGATGAALTGLTGAALLETACSPKSVNAEYSVVKTFLNVVAIELPAQKSVIDKILTVADDFNADYQRGDFVNATAIYTTLEGDVTQLISDLGVNLSSRVKVALVLVDAAVTAIGELLNSQKTAPAVIAAKKQATAAQMTQVTAIERRAAHADKLFAAIK